MAVESSAEILRITTRACEKLAREWVGTKTLVRNIAISSGNRWTDRTVFGAVRTLIAENVLEVDNPMSDRPKVRFIPTRITDADPLFAKPVVDETPPWMTPVYDKEANVAQPQLRIVSEEPAAIVEQAVAAVENDFAGNVGAMVADLVRAHLERAQNDHRRAIENARAAEQMVNETAEEIAALRRQVQDERQRAVKAEAAFNELNNSRQKLAARLSALLAGE